MNTKSILCALPRATLVIWLSFQTLSAATFGKFTYKDDGSTITITRYSPDAVGVVAIPGTIAGKPVTTIGNNAFGTLKGMTGIIIPDSVTKIDDHAFSGTGLTSVTIPAGVTTIGASAFSSCRALSEMVMSDNVTSIGEYAFYYCNLTRISIPNGVTSIGPWAFAYCRDLTHVVIPKSVATLGIGAFGFCEKLSTVSLSEGLTSIGGQAFYSCGNLAGISFPDSLVSIGYNAFDACGLTSVVVPRNVTSIENLAFYACAAMTQISVDARNPSYSSENGVLFDKQKTTIIQYPGGKAGSYSIGDGIIAIQNGAFLSCHGLTSVDIHANVISISPCEFTGCDNLTAIHVEVQNPAYSSDDGVLYNKQKTKLFLFPAGKTGAYYIPAGVTAIGGAAFFDCHHLTCVFIPKSVAKIDSGAFNPCSSLEKAVFYGKAPEIGSGVFNHCANNFRVERLTDSTGFDAPPWQNFWQQVFFPTPEIKVLQPAGKNLLNGSSENAFGSMTVGTTGRTEIFIIKNTGTGSLNHIGITKTGSQKSDFIVTPPASTALAPGESTLFTVTFAPGATGKHRASIHINSNDADQSPFDVRLTGSGAPP